MVVAIIFLATGMMLAGCGRSDERPEFLTVGSLRFGER